jgi:hypothetical protein
MDVMKNNPHVQQNVYLANVFNFEDFLSNSSISQTLFKSSNGVLNSDYEVADYMIQSMISTYAKNSSADDVIALFQTLLLEVDFDVKFVPYIQDTYKTNIKPEVIKMEVFKLVQNINVSNLDRISSEVLDMPDDSFAFGEKLYTFAKDFNVDQFKIDMSGALPSSFFPLLYYKHLIARGMACAGDIDCQRVYNLAQYVFVYFTIMVLFLFVFESTERVNRFAEARAYDMTQLQKMKYDLVAIADSILSRLEEKNILDEVNVGGASKAMSKTSAERDLDKISKLNKQVSQMIKFKKEDLDMLQVNLSSYNDMQNTSHSDVYWQRWKFWTMVMVCVLIVLGVIGQTSNGSWFMADILSLLFAVYLVMVLTGFTKKVYKWVLGIFSE